MIGKWKDHHPQIHPSVFVAPSADIFGQVSIDEYANIWFQVVARGDVNTISIGKRTNIQDHSCLHVTRKTAKLVIGSDVTVGHRALLHGCTIKDRVLVGMGAIVMDNAVIKEDSIVGAGSLVTANKEFPAGSLIMGSPAKVVRELNDEERSFLIKSAANYVSDARDYAAISINS